MKRHADGPADWGGLRPMQRGVAGMRDEEGIVGSGQWLVGGGGDVWIAKPTKGRENRERAKGDSFLGFEC